MEVLKSKHNTPEVREANDYIKKKVDKAEEYIQHLKGDSEDVHQRLKQNKSQKDGIDPRQVLEQAENELRLSQVEFDRQAEITKLLMEGLSQSQTNHVRHLKAFVAAQVEYYAQAHLVMQDLNRELNRFDKTRKYFNFS